MQGAWAGGTATLVQTGDVVDRGPDSLAVLALLDRLKVSLRSVAPELMKMTILNATMSARSELLNIVQLQP